jgi:hypothetical protein
MGIRGKPQSILLAQLVSIITIVVAMYGIREYRVNRNESLSVWNRRLPILLNIFAWCLLSYTFYLSTPDMQYLPVPFLMGLSGVLLTSEQHVMIPLIIEIIGWGLIVHSFNNN